MTEASHPWHRWSAALQRRPAVPAAAVFIGGIATHTLLPHRPAIYLFLAIVIVLTLFLPLSRYAGRGWVRVRALCCRRSEPLTLPSPGVPGERKEATRSGLVALAIFCTAVAAAQIEAFYFSPNDIAQYVNDQPRLAKLEL